MTFRDEFVIVCPHSETSPLSVGYWLIQLLLLPLLRKSSCLFMTWKEKKKVGLNINTSVPQNAS